MIAGDACEDAVASIAPGTTGTVTASYAYDGNGNMLTGRGRTVTWTSFDMVSKITQGANWVSFAYDSEHARLKQTSSDGSTKYYLNDPISGIMQEKVVIPRRHPSSSRRSKPPGIQSPISIETR
jgi:YD repeat-containing protein